MTTYIDQDTLLDEARRATHSEHELTFLRALQLYPKAVAWSIFLSLTLIMEGYDMKLIGSLFAQPAFQKKYGQELPDGTYGISASWQAGLSNGASVGSLMGLLINGYLAERFGFCNTMLASLAFITATIFIPFFAPRIEVLLVGQVLMGIPWGIFQTLTTSYAAEVTPTHLRAYLTTYVNLCWVKLTPSPPPFFVFQLVKGGKVKKDGNNKAYELNTNRSLDSYSPPVFYEEYSHDLTNGPIASPLLYNGSGQSH